MPEFPGLVPGGHWSTKIGKAETDKIAKKKKGTFTITVDDFNTPLLVTERTSKKEKKSVELYY